MSNAASHAPRISTLCSSTEARISRVGLALDDIESALGNVDEASVVVESFGDSVKRGKLTEALDMVREAKRMYEDAAAILIGEVLDMAEAEDPQNRAEPREAAREEFGSFDWARSALGGR
jgi:hypothetical protein